MSFVRPILVILTALSVALLPVTGAAARGFSAPSMSVHADCCPPGQDCDKDSKGDCTQDAACALKCASAVAVPLALAGTALPPDSSDKLAPGPRSNRSLAPNLPLPPPRA